MKEQFIKTYAECMKEHSNKNPGLYLVPVDGWEGLAARMVAVIVAGRANISEQAKRACKKLGGKPTNSGVVEFITNG